MLTEAKKTAEQADIAVLFVGLPDRYESEGYDRKHLQNARQSCQLIEAVCRSSK